MRLTTLLFIFLFTFPGSSYGQFYSNRFRPAENWQELRTEHFRIIFPEGSESTALRTGQILETQYPRVQEITGGSLRNFPFILNTSNQRSNGFVTPLNFRSEVEVPAVRGKSMNPRSGSWLELVLSHELVHALHLSVNTPGPSSLVGLLSPDLRRSIHSAVPVGFFEGLAVSHESHGLSEGGGRGNYPWFTNRFASNLVSGRPWSMGQLVHASTASLPFDRHYVGSYPFIRWLQNRYGNEIMKNTIEYHYHRPFLGFGFALKQTTGHWPASLHYKFTTDMMSAEERRIRSEGKSTTETSILLRHGKEGAVVHRPRWLDDESILMYGSFYNAAQGFYLYNVTKQAFTLLLEHQSVEDFIYSVHPSTGEIWFSGYNVHPVYDNTFTTSLFHLHPRSGTRREIPGSDKLFAPSAGRILLALQTDERVSRLVSVDSESGSLSVMAELQNGDVIQEVQQHPAEPLLAVIARKGTRQAMWITEAKSAETALERPPDISFETGSLTDVDWHPVRKKLLFSSDHTGTLDIYEYDHEAGEIVRVTRSHYNAFEAGYSPAGDKIAYVLQRQGEQLPAILHRADFAGTVLPAGQWSGRAEMFTVADSPRTNGPFPDDPLHDDPLRNAQEWDLNPYRPGVSWLKPRTLLPHVVQWTEGGSELGLRLLSADPLGHHTYSITASRFHDRLWLDAEYEFSGIFPGFRINLFDSPSLMPVRGLSNQQDIPDNLLLQNRGGSISVPFRYTFRRDTRLTTLSFTPGYKYSQVRFFGLDVSGNPLSDFSDIHSLSFQSVFNFRIRRYPRDFQPNAGWILFSQGHFGLNDSGVEFEAYGHNITGDFTGRRGFRAGFSRFFAPLSSLNQSLRLRGQFLTQTRPGPYSNRDVIATVFPVEILFGTNNMVLIDTRYTIPLTYPDDGGLVVPAYLGNLYLALYSQTAGDLNRNPRNLLDSSRTLIGAGIRAKIGISNFVFDFGVGFAYEPARKQWNLTIGQF